MPRIIQNKLPIDLQPSKAIGFGFPIDGPAVFIPTFTTREQTKANLVNYLLTNKGERVFNPNFGANLRSLLFENIVESTQDDIKVQIQDAIGLFFPTVKIEEIEFVNDADRNEVTFNLTYQIQNFGVEDEINIVLQ